MTDNNFTKFFQGKKIVKVALTTTMLLLTASFVNPAEALTPDYSVRVSVNGHYMEFPDQEPFIDADTNRTYVPIRFISEELGAEVSWTQASKTAHINRQNKNIDLAIGSKTPVVNGTNGSTMDAPAVLYGDRTNVPIRFISETLGAEVNWNNNRRTVEITDKNAPRDTFLDGIFESTNKKTKTIKGYEIPVETDLSIDAEGDQCEISWGGSFGYGGDYKEQLKDTYNILKNKFGEEKAEEITRYVSDKRSRWDDVEGKFFYVNDKEICASGGGGYFGYGIVIWGKEHLDE